MIKQFCLIVFLVLLLAGGTIAETKADESESLLLGFSDIGLYQYDSSNWSQLNSAMPNKMVLWGNKLVASFPDNGLYAYDGCEWTYLTKACDDLCVWNNKLIAVFSDWGLLTYDGATWAALSEAPQSVTTWGSKLIANFNHWGVFSYDGSSWTQICKPAQLVTPWRNDLVVGFSDWGLYAYNGSSWNFLLPETPDLVTAWGNKLVASSSVTGIITSSDGTAWTALSSLSADILCEWDSKLVMGFSAYGLWICDGSNWAQLTTLCPIELITGNPTCNNDNETDSGDDIMSDDNNIWVSSTIDSEADTWDTSIALDGNDGVHLLYHNSNGSDSPKPLLYSTNSSGQWVTSTIDNDLGVISDQRSKIAVDSINNVHVGYYDSNNGFLKYATNSTGEWIISTIDNTSCSQGISLAIDPNDHVHISYCDMYELKYATNQNSTWESVTIDVNTSEDIGFLGIKSAVAVDSFGYPHIVYYDRTNAQLKYATNASGQWLTSAIQDSVTIINDFMSIAIDANNCIHLSVSNQKNLFYASNETGQWEFTDLGVDGHYTSIALDSQNNVYISYQDKSLKYISNKTGEWMSKTIIESANAGFHTSIAIDSNDEIHISSHLYTTGNLVYSTTHGDT